MQTLSPQSSRPIARNRRKALLATAVAAILATGIGAAGLSQAQTEAQVPALTATTEHGGQFQLADIIERVQPAVVNIVAQQSAIRPANMRGMDPRMEEMLRRFFGPGMPPGHPDQDQPMQSANALGSGFIIDSEGYVVTNNHVIEGAEQVEVVLEDGTTLPARVVGTDPRSDLAVLKVESDKPLPSVAFGDSDAARVGEWVVAIGNPFGLGGTATAGIISARGRDIQSGPYDDYLQIDAPINRGNSGGPVFDTGGRVIGINTAIFSPNGGSVGIGFAIPASQAQPAIQQMIENGHVTRGWLGVQIQPVTEEIRSSLGLENTHGALISDVSTDSPAHKAGLEVTDVILDFDGQAVDDSRSLVRLVGRAKPDQKVPVTVWREGKKQTLKVKLGTLQDPEQEVVAANQPGSDTGKLGLKVAPLDKQAREQLTLDDSVQGVLVTGVAPNSSAAKQGLRPGDVILRIGQSPVDTPQSLATAVESASKQGDSVLALVRRGDSQRFVALKLG
ncbi:MAG: DegQ family serine endoprotease [Gammaproteobacteria bacterium]|jgi:serine protease Do|nr:DegQ family serine endoprotease [Gammaproteobacteria bacterium]